MQLQVKGRNVEVTDGLRTRAEEKLGKLAKLLPDVSQVELELRVERNPSRAGEAQAAEATIWTKGPIFRACEASADMYGSIDRVTEKLSRQIRRFAERRTSRRHDATLSSSPIPLESLPPLPADAAIDPADGRIVKTKQFTLAPMSPDDAALQMELVGHDFFVFSNAADDNRTSVVYRRADGDYGVITPA